MMKTIGDLEVLQISGGDGCLSGTFQWGTSGIFNIPTLPGGVSVVLCGGCNCGSHDLNLYCAGKFVRNLSGCYGEVFGYCSPGQQATVQGDASNNGYWVTMSVSNVSNFK